VTSAAIAFLAVRAFGLLVKATVRMIPLLIRQASWMLMVALAAGVQAIATRILTGASVGLAGAFSLAAAGARAFLVTLLGMPVVIGMVAGVIVLLIEEILAIFTDKVGLFEQMTGRWGQLANTFWASAGNPKEHWLNRTLDYAIAAFSELFDQIDKFFYLLAEISQGDPMTALFNTVSGNAFSQFASKKLTDAWNAHQADATAQQYGGTGARTSRRSGRGNEVMSDQTTVPFASSRRTGRGQSEDVRVTLDVNANGASGADKQLASNIAEAAAEKVYAKSRRSARGVMMPSSVIP
jgi:hypothetical protein